VLLACQLAAAALLAVAAARLPVTQPWGPARQQLLRLLLPQLQQQPGSLVQQLWLKLPRVLLAGVGALLLALWRATAPAGRRRSSPAPPAEGATHATASRGPFNSVAALRGGSSGNGSGSSGSSGQERRRSGHLSSSGDAAPQPLSPDETAQGPAAISAAAQPGGGASSSPAAPHIAPHDSKAVARDPLAAAPPPPLTPVQPPRLATFQPLPYKSAVRRRTTRVKVHGAEPGQLAPGYEARVGAAAAARGAVVAGLYVRAGALVDTWI
jgi:hypothetical protein